jgi:hypothetical protein
MNSDLKIVEGRVGSAPARVELPPNPVVCIFEPDHAEESAVADRYLHDAKGAGRNLVMTESEFVSAPANTNLKALT